MLKKTNNLICTVLCMTFNEGNGAIPPTGEWRFIYRIKLKGGDEGF